MQAVIFHSSDRERAAVKTPGAPAADGGAEERKVGDPPPQAAAAAPVVELKDFLAAVGVLRRLRVVADELYSEAHERAVPEGHAAISVKDVEGNMRLLREIEDRLTARRLELKVQFRMSIFGCSARWFILESLSLSSLPLFVPRLFVRLYVRRLYELRILVCPSFNYHKRFDFFSCCANASNTSSLRCLQRWAMTVHLRGRMCAQRTSHQSCARKY